MGLGQVPKLRLKVLAATVIGMVTVADAGVPSLSVTLNTTLTADAAVVGVPVIAPVELLRLNPAGRLPEVTEKVYGWTPPTA
jgi:hypothetical protein